MDKIDLHTVATPALAYLGDAVLELLVRERLVREGYSSSKSLNTHAKRYVSAPAQAMAMEKLCPYLTQEEETAFRRGRNMGHTNTPKNATVAQYRSATGMEVLFGYLYCKKEDTRLRQLFEIAYQKENEDENTL